MSPDEGEQRSKMKARVTKEESQVIKTGRIRCDIRFRTEKEKSIREHSARTTSRLSELDMIDGGQSQRREREGSGSEQ